MRALTDHVHEDHDPTIAPLTKAWGPEGPWYTLPETEDFCEEIER
jgi:hypothetical protein